MIQTPTTRTQSALILSERSGQNISFLKGLAKINHAMLFLEDKASEPCSVVCFFAARLSDSIPGAGRYGMVE